MFARFLGTLALLLGLHASAAASVAQDAAPLGLFDSPGELSELRRGFVEVSSDFSRWAKRLGTRPELEVRALVASASTKYTTETELRQLYDWTGYTYERAAGHPMLAGICSPEALVDGSASRAFRSVEHRPVSAILGRALARREEGERPWEPSFNAASEDVWFAFEAYAKHHGLQDYVDALYYAADGGTLTDEESCAVQAKVYLAAARRPNDRFGGIRLIDFARALELLTLESFGLE